MHERVTDQIREQAALHTVGLLEPREAGRMRYMRVGAAQLRTNSRALAPGPSSPFAVNQVQQRVRKALQVLTPEQRQAIELAFFSGLSHSQVAAQLGQPLGTVKTRIRTGMIKLREQLAS